MLLHSPSPMLLLPVCVRSLLQLDDRKALASPRCGSMKGAQDGD